LNHHHTPSDNPAALEKSEERLALAFDELAKAAHTRSLSDRLAKARADHAQQSSEK